MVYNFKGEFKKKIVDQQTINNLFSSVYSQYILYNGNFFAAQNIALYKLIDKDSLWSFAFLDTAFQEKKLFKNPAHMGREELIIANCVDKGRMINLWMEYQTSIDTYNNQLTLKYPLYKIY